MATAVHWHIDPSLRDMSFADVNPAFNLAASQDSHSHGADGNSIPGGEPVHRSAFFLKTLMSLHFQLSPRSQTRRPSQTRQTCV